MGLTHRNSNLSIAERRAKLLADIKRGKENDLAFVPETFVSITDAKRKYKLCDEDLQSLKGRAIVATKFGQEGIFYPLEDVESLKNSKINPVTADMIPENLIRRQLPRDFKTAGMFERLRKFAATWELPGHVGTREGHKGRPTYFYTKEVLKRELGLEVITEEMEEGIDYLEFSSVLIEARAELSHPPLALNVGSPSERAKRCYFREQVEHIGTRWSKNLVRRSSRCTVKQQRLESTTTDQLESQSSSGEQGSLATLNWQGSYYSSLSDSSQFSSEENSGQCCSISGTQESLWSYETQGSQSSPGTQGSKNSLVTHGSQNGLGTKGSRSTLGTQGSQSTPEKLGSQYSPGTQGSQYSPGTQGSQYSPGTQGSLYSPGVQRLRCSPGKEPSRIKPGILSSQSSSGSVGSGSQNNKWGHNSQSSSREQIPSETQ